MTQNLTLEVVTPQRILLETTADYVTVPGIAGELGILSGHIPLLTGLQSGVLSYKSGGEQKSYAIHYGYAEVCRDKITILAKLAESAEEIDLDRAKAAHDKAKTKLAELEKKLDDAEMMAKFQAKLLRSLTRQSAAKL